MKLVLCLIVECSVGLSIVYGRFKLIPYISLALLLALMCIIFQKQKAKEGQSNSKGNSNAGNQL